MEVAIASNIVTATQLDPGWRWRDREGNFHHPADMATRHLFYTLRMIWNNKLPAAFHVGNVTLYSFSRFYTDEFLRQSIFHLHAELVKRKLPDYIKREFDQMQEMVNRGCLNQMSDIHPKLGGPNGDQRKAAGR